MGSIIVTPVMQVFDDDGGPGSGYKLNSYEPGTSTPKALYSDAACSVAHTNPVIFDSRGEATIHGEGAYKLVLTDADDNVKWTVNSVVGIEGAFAFTSIDDYSDNLSTAVSTIGATETTLFIDTQASVSGNITVPRTLKLAFLKGGSVDQSTYSLTINGPIEAGLFQVFDGTGAVTFGDGACEKIFPEWWGALADNSTDCTTALQAAIDSAEASDIRKIQLSGGVYRISDVLTISAGQANLDLTIDGDWHSQIYQTDTGGANGFTIGEADGSATTKITFKGFDLLGNPSAGHGISLLHARNCMLKELHISSFGGDGAYCDDAWGNHFERCYISGNSGHGISLNSDCNAVEITGCNISSHTTAGKAGIYIDGCDDPHIIGGDLSVNTYGVYIANTEASNQILIFGVHTEGNTTAIHVDNPAGGENLYGINIQGCFFYEDPIVIGDDNIGTSISGMIFKGNYLNNANLTTIDGDKVLDSEVGPNVLAGTAAYSFGDQNIMTSNMPVAETMPRYTAAAEFPYGTANVGIPGDIRWNGGNAAICTATQEWRFFQTQKISDLETTPLVVGLPTGATPSVSGLRACITANTGAISVTSLGDGYPGQELIVIGGDGGNTTFVDDGSYLNLAGGDFILGDDDCLHLVSKNGTHWQEVSRANN